MKTKCILVAGWLALSATLSAGANPNARRDAALQQLEACSRNDRADSRACKKQAGAVATLTEIYRAGDKSVVPALLRVSWAGDFYREALIADPDGFLAALADLPNPLRERAVYSLGGEIFGLRKRSRVDAVRAPLIRVPAESVHYALAQECLRKVDIANASLLLDYFPPQTFTSRAGEFQVTWYSREMYALGEKPLWPATSGQTLYRFTWLRSFLEPVIITVTAQPDGSAELRLRAGDHRRAIVERTLPVSAEHMANALALIEHSDFWQLPTEDVIRGFDGAEWILEGTKGGNYHVVERWSPEKTPFAKAALELIALSGYDSKGHTY